MSFQGFSKVISFSFSFYLIVRILLFKFIYLFKNFFILTVFKYNFLLLFFLRFLGSKYRFIFSNYFNFFYSSSF